MKHDVTHMDFRDKLPALLRGALRLKLRETPSIEVHSLFFPGRITIVENQQ